MRITSASATPIDIRLSESLPTGAGGIGDRGGMRVTITAEDSASSKVGIVIVYRAADDGQVPRVQSNAPADFV